MKGLSPEALATQWSTLLPRGAVVMARRGEAESTEAPAPAAAQSIHVILPSEHHHSPFVAKMLGSIGIAETDYQFLTPAEISSTPSLGVLVFFQTPGVPVPAHSMVFTLPSLERIQKEPLAKREAWEALKLLAKALGKALPSR